jgi:predicted amino acid dehydrogenase
MADQPVKEVVSISIGSSLRDHIFEFEFMGEKYRVRRIGTDGDKQKAKNLIREWDGKAAAIGLGGIDVYFSIGKKTFVHQDGKKLLKAARITPVVDGSGLKHTLERWVIAYLHNFNPDILNNQDVLVMSGADRFAMAEVLSEFTNKLYFGDMVFHLRIPIILRNLNSIKRVSNLLLPLFCKLPFEWIYPTGRRQETRRERCPGIFKKVKVIVGDFHLIRRYAPYDLSGKTIITNTVTVKDREDLKARGVECLVTTTPLMDGRTFGVNVLEAIFIAHLMERGFEFEHDKPAGTALRDEYLDIILDSRIEPYIEQLNPTQETVKNKFAFVIHPMKLDDYFRLSFLRWMRKLPPTFVERALTNLPPFCHAKTSVIKSPDGKETQGYFYVVSMTPKMMMSQNEERVYSELIRIANMAKNRNCGIMGLGAFTSVVGDAGFTVAKRSPIAVTSGNSLTIWATIETAKRTSEMMGIDLGKASVMVVGATGSIGSAITRMLAPHVHRMAVISRRPERVLEFSREIQQVCKNVDAGTSVDTFIGDMDLVIATTTDPEGVIDVMKLKPGCVVLDVARPPDVSKEEADKRDDVLVIESGEIKMPCDVDWGMQFGLPKNIAFACLAETILLALCGRFESFTLGRELDIEKIKEIGQLALDNGFELSPPISFGKMLTNEEIYAIRDRAKNRMKQAKTPSKDSKQHEVH